MGMKKKQIINNLEKKIIEAKRQQKNYIIVKDVCQTSMEYVVSYCSLNNYVLAKNQKNICIVFQYNQEKEKTIANAQRLLINCEEEDTTNNFPWTTYIGIAFLSAFIFHLWQCGG